MDLIVSTKWTITRLTCAVMLHNQTAMKVSMVIQGKTKPLQKHWVDSKFM